MVRIFKGSCLAKQILAVVSQRGLVLVSMAVVVVGGDCKFPICGNPKFLAFDLSLTVRRAAVLALPTVREAVRRCMDGRSGCC